MNCFGEITDSIVMSCTNPLIGGCSGRAKLLTYSSGVTYTFDTTNKNQITGITADEAITVEVISQQPFEGSGTELNFDSGRPSFNKTIVVRFSQRGADASRSVIDPMVHSAEGYGIVIEKLNKVADGSYEVIGVDSPLKVTACTRNEYENGADWIITLQCNEPRAEYALAGSTYAASKALFEAL